MNIGIVTTWFPAGAGYVAMAYRRTLQKEHEVFIYARAGQCMKKDPFWGDEQVTWAPRHYIITGIWSRNFKKWILKNKIEIIIFNEQRHWQPIINAKKIGVCVGAYIDYYTQDTINAFSIYDFLICNTRRHLSVFDWHQKCYYIPWGTDINLYRPKNNIQNQSIVFLASAGWEGSGNGDRRGTLLALKSFLRLVGNCKLLLFSQIPIEKCTGEFKKLVLSDKRIEFRYGTFYPFPYEEGDVYLYPSRLDGIGLSLPEAISCGLASITTNCAPMNEFVQDDFNGYLVNVDRYLGRHDGYYWAESICSIDSLTEKMQKYIDDPNILNRHKINSRLYAEKYLDWNFNSQLLLKLIQANNLTINCSSDELYNQIISLDKKSSPSICQQLIRLGLVIINEFGSLVKRTYQKWN